MAQNHLLEGFFSYMGNKNSLCDWIIPQFPMHKTYVEVFGGTFAIGLNKPKIDGVVEIYNDFNSNLSNLFEIVRTRHEEFLEELDKTIISEEWHKKFYGNHSDFSPMENAVRYFYVMLYTFRGKYDGGFSYTAENSYCKMMERKREVIKEIHKRIKNVIVLNKNCFDVVRQNNDKDTLLYLDPPYVDTEQYYKHLAGTFGETEHIKLRDMLEQHKGHFFLSYEDDPLVSDLYRKFKIHRKQLFRGSSNTVRYEVLVTNYEPVQNLFSFPN